MHKTTFKIAKMDCVSEEQMIRMKLQGFDEIDSLNFDLINRKLEVYHTGDYRNVLSALNTLRLDTSFLESKFAEEEHSEKNENNERKLFLLLFIINFTFFVVEIVAGLLAHSMGLIADSLDMLADAIIFGISLFVIGKAINRKRRVAKISGYFQLTLALLGIIEVIRRFSGFSETPDYKTMMFVSSFALIGNVFGLYLIQKAKTKHEAHIQAGKIFLSNDVIINIGVIAAGVLVLLTSSRIPDLVVGSIVFVLVAAGAYRILNL